jgi:hypothetical protein
MAITRTGAVAPGAVSAEAEVALEDGAHAGGQPAAVKPHADQLRQSGKLPGGQG